MKNRAWCVLSGKGSFIHFNTGEEGRYDWEVFDEDPYFDSYTGMCDVSGKDIYVNDIINAFLPGMAGGYCKYQIVVFQVGCFGTIIGSTFTPLFKLEDIKIVGHCHKS